MVAVQALGGAYCQLLDEVWAASKRSTVARLAKSRKQRELLKALEGTLACMGAHIGVAARSISHASLPDVVMATSDVDMAAAVAAELQHKVAPAAQQQQREPVAATVEATLEEDAASPPHTAPAPVIPDLIDLMDEEPPQEVIVTNPFTLMAPPSNAGAATSSTNPFAPQPPVAASNNPFAPALAASPGPASGSSSTSATIALSTNPFLPAPAVGPTPPSANPFAPAVLVAPVAISNPFSMSGQQQQVHSTPFAAPTQATVHAVTSSITQPFADLVVKF
jgi:hypothetical protein